MIQDLRVRVREEGEEKHCKDIETDGQNEI